MPLLKPSSHPLSPAECSSEAFASLGKCESQSYAFNLNYCVKEIPETMPLTLAQGQILPERLALWEITKHKFPLPGTGLFDPTVQDVVDHM